VKLAAGDEQLIALRCVGVRAVTVNPAGMKRPMLPLAVPATLPAPR
jgi:hypothetical protein